MVSTLEAAVARHPQAVVRFGMSRQVYGISDSLVYFIDKRIEGQCRMCLRPEIVRALTRHHLVPLRWFLETRDRRQRYAPIRNVAPNQVPLCRPCHDQVEKTEQGKRELRRVLAPDEVTYIVQLTGYRWLAKHYPKNALAPL